MVYLNIDTELGIIGLGNKPHEAPGPTVGKGAATVEIWAQNLRPVTEDHVEVNGVTVYKMEEPDRTFNRVEPGHAVLNLPIGKPGFAFADTARFDPNTLERFKMWNGRPEVTVIKDGEVLAKNVKEYESSWLHRPVVQAGIGVVGVAIATGFIGRWLGWW